MEDPKKIQLMRKKIVQVRLWIGIDPGVNGGIATYSPSEKKIMGIDTLPFFDILEYLDFQMEEPFVAVILEDARKRGAHPKDRGNVKKLQGVGMIKERCRLFEEYMRRKGIPFVLVSPRLTKIKPDAFKHITGVGIRTNEHERDACMMVYSRPWSVDWRQFDNNFSESEIEKLWQREEEKKALSQLKKKPNSGGRN